MSDAAGRPRRAIANLWLFLSTAVYFELTAMFFANFERNPGVLPSDLTGEPAPHVFVSGCGRLMDTLLASLAAWTIGICHAVRPHTPALALAWAASAYAVLFMDVAVELAIAEEIV